MALSDYAFIAFDKNGKSTTQNGEFGRFSVEPYKTWLYLHSKNLWKEGERFCKDTVAQVNAGNCIIFDTEFTIESVDLTNKDGIPYSTVNLFYCQRGFNEKMVCYGGILCYAHLNYERKIARDMGIPDYCEIGGGSNSDGNGSYIEILWGYDPTGKYNRGETFQYPLPPKYQGKESFYAYCGITDDMMKEFLNWKIPNQEWLEKVKNSEKKYTNQGNAYFGEKLGFDSSQNIGENVPVIAHEMIKTI